MRLTAPFLAAMLGVVTPVAVGADADTAAPDDAIQSGEVRSADGVRLAYREAGEGTPTLVLIHGWLCDQSHWDGVLPVLIRRHHVVTLDLAGHGRSGRERTDYTLESFAADVESVVNARSREPLVLVGHSMGGLVALAAAERLQPRVRLIVAVDSLREVMSGPVSEPEIKASEASLKEDFPGYVYRLVRDRMFTPQSDPALAERVAGAMSRADVEVGLSARREAMRANVPRLLSASTVPIVAFEPSSLVPYEQQMPPNLRQPFRVVSIANAGHFIMLERPTEFQAALTSLVDNMK